MTGGRLSGCRVAVTRRRPGRLADLLTAEGAEVVHVPTIEIVDTQRPELGDALDRLDDHDWLVVTSPEGAVRVASAAADHPGVRLAAVGTATAASLAEDAGRPVDLVPDRQDAVGLIGEFPASPSVSVLVAQGDLAPPTLVEGLRSLGHRVDAVEAYVTRAVALERESIDLLRGCDAILLASGSAARSLVGARNLVDTMATTASGDPSPLIVAIGPTTAEDSSRLGLKPDAVATDHSVTGLVDELIRSWTLRHDGRSGRR